MSDTVPRVQITDYEYQPASEIEVCGLTSYQVAPDGSGVCMHIIDASGNPARIWVPKDCLQTLAFTMPKMVSDTLSGGRGDPTIRVVHGVEHWNLERASDGATAIITFVTKDQMATSFALHDHDRTAMVDALSTYDIEDIEALQSGALSH